MTSPIRSLGQRKSEMYNSERVTVICIAYNHEKWIEKALVSVLLQDFENRELLIVDNGSSDHTPEIIETWVKNNCEKLSITSIYNKVPEPYCRLFNKVLNQVESKFVVDLSGDDYFYANHLSISIKKLIEIPDAAFVFSDAMILNESGDQFNYYKGGDYDTIAEKIVAETIYETLIRRSYICSPTIVFKTEILKMHGGYDDTLSYEDFDIQLRLARNHPLAFSNHVGVVKRKHSKSLSANQYQIYHSQMLPSTLKVCEKISRMNKSPSEDLALKERILYELKHALWSANFDTAMGFANLGRKLKVKNIEFSFYKLWLRFRFDVSWLYVRLT